MVQFKGVTVTIQVEGRPLTEYLDEESNGTTPSIITRYIQSCAGQAFDLKIKGKSAAFNYCTGIVCVYSVDGIIIKRFSLEYGQNHDAKIQGPDGYVNGVWSTQQMHFADLKTNENQLRACDIAEYKKQLDTTGLITLDLYRAHNFRRSNQPVIHPEYQGELSQVKSVPEKALKGQAIDLAAHVRGAEPTAKRSGSLEFDYIDPGKQSYMTFNFKYRSRKALQAMCIIPRSPTPLALEDRPRESLSREELLELLDRHVQRRPRSRSKEVVKREGQSKRPRDDDVKDILASAHSSERKRTRKIEFIDLSDD